MEIPNYDSKSNKKKNSDKQLYQYMPDDTFRMLICGGSGSGKTNLLYHMLMKPLVYYDQVHLHAKNLEQEKYQNMIILMKLANRLVMMYLFVVIMK